LATTSRIGADLNLVILQESDQGRLAFRYLVSSADGVLNLAPYGPHSIGAEPGAFIHALFDELDAMPKNRWQWDREKAQRLERIGTSLFEVLMPSDLRTVLWGIRDRISTVFIQTEEPWIPWELCRLSGDGAAGVEEGPFLCEAYELSRWCPGTGLKRSLTANKFGLIAPRGTNLPSQAAEVEMLKALTTPSRQVLDIETTYEGVLKAFGGAVFDVIHFTGHGENVDPANAMRSVLDLTDDAILRPSDLSGVVRNLGNANPLVFLNACQLGQASMGLHGIGGWASAFLNAGAAAFLGSHWDLTDHLAKDFATRFYDEALAGATLAAAVRTARLEIRRQDDPTWLAYTLHAAPGVSLN
jgi:hypothetical protein